MFKKILKKEKQITLPDGKNCGYEAITRHRNSSRNAAMPAVNEQNFPILSSSAKAFSSNLYLFYIEIHQ